MIRGFVILAFFISGASSLMLEVVWSKALGHVLGNTLEAITTVVAAYMGGLALGASLAGRAAGQRRPSYGVPRWASACRHRPPFSSGPLGPPGGLCLGRQPPMRDPLPATFPPLVPTTLMGATLDPRVGRPPADGARAGDPVRGEHRGRRPARGGGFPCCRRSARPHGVRRRRVSLLGR
jgi:hypothetical protein